MWNMFCFLEECYRSILDIYSLKVTTNIFHETMKFTFKKTVKGNLVSTNSHKWILGVLHFYLVFWYKFPNYFFSFQVCQNITMKFDKNLSLNNLSKDNVTFQALFNNFTSLSCILSGRLLHYLSNGLTQIKKQKRM